MTDWEVQFDFQIKGQKMLGGDGFAFWYTDTPEVLGTVYGAADYWKGLGVFFDTYDNNAVGQNPLITAIVNDGTMRYDAGSDGEDQASGKCSYQLRNLQKPSRAKIKYQDETLSVSIAVQNDGDFEPCFRVGNVKLGVDKYFGLSAHTGDVADSHDIYQLSTTDLSQKDADLKALREDYKKFIDEQQEAHDSITTKEFQHNAMTLLHQIQGSLVLLENAMEEKTAETKKLKRSTTGNADSILTEINELSNVLRKVNEAVELTKNHAPVDRDFITRQMNAIKGEVVNLRGVGASGRSTGLVASGGGDMQKQLDEIKQDQIQIKMMLQRIERTMAGTSGSSRSYSSSGLGGSLRSGGGTSWFTYLIYLVILGALIGGGVYAYKWYQNSQKRQYKLL